MFVYCDIWHVQLQVIPKTFGVEATLEIATWPSHTCGRSWKDYRKYLMWMKRKLAIHPVQWVHQISSPRWASRVCLLLPLPAYGVVANRPAEMESNDGLLHGRRCDMAWPCVIWVPRFHTVLQCEALQRLPAFGKWPEIPLHRKLQSAIWSNRSIQQSLTTWATSSRSPARFCKCQYQCEGPLDGNKAIHFTQQNRSTTRSWEL